MHSGSSNINVPVDVSVKAKGRALRDGKLAPNQSFARIARGDLDAGDWLYNPGTLQLHRVIKATSYGVTITVKPCETEGIQHVASWERWEDVMAVLWKVVET